MIDADKIPQELKDRPQWMCWKRETRKGKPTKPPYCVRTGKPADVQDPQNWCSFEVALNAYQAGLYDGIGYALNDDYLFVDLDQAHMDLVWKPWAFEIISSMGQVYIETSPSGNGAHVVSRGRLLEGWTGLNRKYHDGKVEIYSRERYMTVTGNRIPGSVAQITDQSACILKLYKKIGGSNGNGNGKRSTHMRTPKNADTDNVSINDRLEAALRDPKFSRLWYGDISAYNNDDSRADLALCNKIVFYFGPDPTVIDSVFRQSGLMRPKWERADYREMTIAKAIADTRETYQPNPKMPKNGQAMTQPARQKTSSGEPRKENSETQQADTDNVNYDDQPPAGEPDLDTSTVANLSNAVKILETDSHFKDRVWFDEFLNRMMTGNPAREWRDDDDINLTVEIQRKKNIPKMAYDTVSKAVVAVARKRIRNCVRDWLNSLRWDNKARIEYFFENHFGAEFGDEGNSYTRAVSKNFWLSMVARIYSPGCKSDYMVILEGSQGLKKSMALETIGGEYYAENDDPVSSKDFLQNLNGKFLVEITEMDAFSKADVTRVKAIVSCRSDRYRESYGRHSKDHPRQCIFVGTTNKDDWNKDSTGARRFWPIVCRDIDTDAIRVIRDQLFAEAVHRFKQGESWWEMPAEETEAEQSQRYTDDVWTVDIEIFIRPKASVTVRDILIECLKFDIAKIDKSAQMRVADCLRRLKWTKGDKKKRVHGQSTVVWYPPEC